MEYLFAYGTLTNNEIQETVFGRVLKGTSDQLIGYELKEILIEEEFGMAKYPIITATNSSKDIIKGMLYQLSEKELQLADTYEGRHYKRIEVELISNEVVWVYSACI